MVDREGLAARDRADPLAAWRDAFALPPDVIYLDGNSLGPLPKAAEARIAAVVREEWGASLIRGWTAHGWIDLPRRAGDRIAKLIGARPGEVMVADSTSINLFKLIVAALRLRPGKPVVLSEAENFPTDLYIAEGATAALGEGRRLVLAPRARLIEAIDDETALVMLTHVDFKSGALHDMPAITRAAQAKGALMLWDLSHSVGALPVDLNAANADLAVGCGYKYLNGGPGAPAFGFVAARHQAGIDQPLTGWLGHAQPFEFATRYVPADGIARLTCGTPPILSLAALDCALEMWERVDMTALRAKSMALTTLFAELAEARCAGHGLTLASPRDASTRGSQISFRHAEGYAVMQALIARGVIGDFRAPDLMRFGFAPLYLRFVDVWDAVEHMVQVLGQREWDRPAHRQRAAVT
jgi:kynureninase